jgi:hypothetical protein
MRWDRELKEFRRLSSSFDRLAAALSQEVHEGTPKEERRARQKKAVADVIRVVDRGDLRIPQPVQFFRSFSDGLGEHYEGWTFSRNKESGLPDPTPIKFYEVANVLELHRPYLYLAATNPSAIDVVCDPLEQRFLGAP